MLSTSLECTSKIDQNPNRPCHRAKRRLHNAHDQTREARTVLKSLAGVTFRGIRTAHLVAEFTLVIMVSVLQVGRQRQRDFRDWAVGVIPAADARVAAGLAWIPVLFVVKGLVHSDGFDGLFEDIDEGGGRLARNIAVAAEFDGAAAAAAADGQY